MAYVNLTTTTTEVEQDAGHQVHWLVEMEAFPKPVIKWYRPGNEEIISSAKYEIRGDNKKTHLIINQVRLKDIGVYRLVVTANHATASKNFTLKVRGSSLKN